MHHKPTFTHLSHLTCWLQMVGWTKQDDHIFSRVSKVCLLHASCTYHTAGQVLRSMNTAVCIRPLRFHNFSSKNNTKKKKCKDIIERHMRTGFNWKETGNPRNKLCAIADACQSTVLDVSTIRDQSIGILWCYCCTRFQSRHFSTHVFFACTSHEAAAGSGLFCSTLESQRFPWAHRGKANHAFKMQSR